MILSNEDFKYDGEGIIGLVVGRLFPVALFVKQKSNPPFSDAQFRDNFAEFVSGLTGTEVRDLTDLIAYNEKHAHAALPHRKSSLNHSTADDVTLLK